MDTTTTDKSGTKTFKPWNPISNTVLIVMLGLTGWLYYINLIPVQVLVLFVIAAFFIARAI